MSWQPKKKKNGFQNQKFYSSSYAFRNLRKYATFLIFSFSEAFLVISTHIWMNDNRKTKQFCFYLLWCICRLYDIEHNHRKIVLRKLWLIFVNHFVYHFKYENDIKIYFSIMTVRLKTKSMRCMHRITHLTENSESYMQRIQNEWPF